LVQAARHKPEVQMAMPAIILYLAPLHLRAVDMVGDTQLTVALAVLAVAQAATILAQHRKRAAQETHLA